MQFKFLVSLFVVAMISVCGARSKHSKREDGNEDVQDEEVSETLKDENEDEQDEEISETLKDENENEQEEKITLETLNDEPLVKKMKEKLKHLPKEQQKAIVEKSANEAQKITKQLMKSD